MQPRRLVVEGRTVLGFTIPEIAIIAIIFAMITVAPRVAGVGERLGDLLFPRDINDATDPRGMNDASDPRELEASDSRASDDERDAAGPASQSRVLDREGSQEGAGPRDPSGS